ncbi:MAG: hypothetical protein JXR64_03025 [Spirochaetales bacterium]|nr:hypothetical protein [Spirochaetales bacterium]
MSKLTPDGLIKNLSPTGSLLILIIFIVAPLALDYLKEDKVVNELKELKRAVIDNKLNNLTKRAAMFIYAKTLNYSKNEVFKEVEDILEKNTISKMNTQIEIRDKLHNRIGSFYKRDFGDLSQFYYDNIPLSFVLRDINPDDVTDVITNYMFTHTHMDYGKLKSDLEGKINDKFYEFYLICIGSLDKEINVPKMKER